MNIMRTMLNSFSCMYTNVHHFHSWMIDMVLLGTWHCGWKCFPPLKCQIVISWASVCAVWYHQRIRKVIWKSIGNCLKTIIQGYEPIHPKWEDWNYKQGRIGGIPPQVFILLTKQRIHPLPPLFLSIVPPIPSLLSINPPSPWQTES